MRLCLFIGKVKHVEQEISRHQLFCNCGFQAERSVSLLSARVPGDKGPTRMGDLRVHAGHVWGGSLSLLSLEGQVKKQLPQAGEGSRYGRGWETGL